MTHDPQAAAGAYGPGPWPSVDVVVPTRDRPELLRLTLASIREQDYPGAVRTLVVHDQSEPDESLKSASVDRPVLVLSNRRSTGLAGARNTGVEASGADLVAFCDDDDTWRPGRLRAQVEALAGAPDAVLATCGITVHYADHAVDRTLARTRVGMADLLRSRLTELHPSTFLMRRPALLERVGLVDEQIPGSYAEDYEFLLRAARVADLVNVSAPHVDVRWHERSFFAARWETISTALVWLLERYPEFRQEPRGLARVLGQIAFAEAASRHRGTAVRYAMRTLRHYPLEARAALALAVAAGAVSPDRVLRTLHRRGRGI